MRQSYEKSGICRRRGGEKRRGSDVGMAWAEGEARVAGPMGLGRRAGGAGEKFGFCGFLGREWWK
jgi:hypothetical protein